MANKKTTAKKSVSKGTTAVKNIAAAVKNATKSSNKKTNTKSSNKKTNTAKANVAKAQADGKKKTTATKTSKTNTAKANVTKAQNDGKKKTTTTKASNNSTTTKKSNKKTNTSKTNVAKAQADGKKKTATTNKQQSVTNAVKKGADAAAKAANNAKNVAKSQNDGKKKTNHVKNQQVSNAIKKGADTVANKAKTVSTIAKAQGQGQKKTAQVKNQQVGDAIKKGASTVANTANAVKNVAKAQTDGKNKTEQTKAQQNNTSNSNSNSSGGSKTSSSPNNNNKKKASPSKPSNDTPIATFSSEMPKAPQREESEFQKRALSGPDPSLVENGGAVGNLYSGVGTDRTDLLARMVDGLRVNSLDNYISPQMRSDYIRDEKQIRDSLNAATNASYDVQRAKALQDAATAEDTNYANTKNAVAEMRKNLIGSGSSGANVGAANATALQALLGLGQQNTATTTEGLRNINNVERERSSALAQNAVDSINQANAATNDMYGAGTSAYGSDRSYGAQGAAQGIAEIRNGANTNLTNLIMNRETNTSQENVAGMNNTSQENVANINSAAQEAVARLNADATTQAAKLGQKSTQTIINKRR